MIGSTRWYIGPHCNRHELVVEPVVPDTGIVRQMIHWVANAIDIPSGGGLYHAEWLVSVCVCVFIHLVVVTYSYPNAVVSWEWDPAH